MKTRIALFFALHGVLLAVPMSLAALDTPAGDAPTAAATPAVIEPLAEEPIILASF
jgi:hypothetical protein